MRFPPSSPARTDARRGSRRGGSETGPPRERTGLSRRPGGLPGGRQAGRQKQGHGRGLAPVGRGALPRGPGWGQVVSPHGADYHLYRRGGGRTRPLGEKERIPFFPGAAAWGRAGGIVRGPVPEGGTGAAAAGNPGPPGSRFLPICRGGKPASGAHFPFGIPLPSASGTGAVRLGRGFGGRL